jgi:hypothetical protein
MIDDHDKVLLYVQNLNTAHPPFIISFPTVTARIGQRPRSGIVGTFSVPLYLFQLAGQKTL